MQAVNLHHAKAHLSSLVQKVYDGEEILICKAGKPMVKLVKYSGSTLPRAPGILKNKIKVTDDFNSPSQEIIDLFYGKGV